MGRKWGSMRGKRKSITRVLGVVTILTISTLSLVGCGDGTKNIDEKYDYKSEDSSEDAYTIAYANIINIDAAVKYKQDSVLNDVSNIQLMYGEYDKALQTIDLALAFSDDMMLITNKIKLLEKFSDYEARDLLVEQVISEQSDNYLLMNLDDKLYFNFLLISNYDNQTAIENYFKILEDDVDESYLDGIYNNLGWAYLNLYDYENAKIYCEKALEYDPTDSITLSNLGNCYYGLDDNEKALEIYDQAMQSDPYNTYAIFGYASAAQSLENYEDAIEVWNQYLTILPNDVDGWDGLYGCYLSIEDVEGQNVCLDALISLAPDNRSYAYDQLIVQQELATLFDPDEVIRTYRKATNDFEANWLIADFTYNYVSAEQGLKLYETVLAVDAMEYWEFASLAEDAYYLDETELLSRILDVTEASLSKEERLEIEAYLYYYDEDADRLMAVASEIVAINPENGYGYEYLGDAYYFAENYEKASASYELALTYSEDTYYSSKALTDCLILLGRIDEAALMNNQLLEDYPNDATLHVNQARIEMKTGNGAAAIDHLVTASVLSEYLGDIFETYEELAPLKGNPALSGIK